MIFQGSSVQVPAQVVIDAAKTQIEGIETVRAKLRQEIIQRLTRPKFFGLIRGMQYEAAARLVDNADSWNQPHYARHRVIHGRHLHQLKMLKRMAELAMSDGPNVTMSISVDDFDNLDL